MGLHLWGVRLPDWRKTDDYRFPETFPPNRWAWEFLRRNPGYQADWNAALSRFRSGVGEFEDYSENARADDVEDPEFYLFVEERKKWHLSALLNPAVDEPNHLGFELDFGRMRRLKEGASFTARGPTYAIVEFNLHLSLPPQLELAERKLKHAQQSLKIKPHLSRPQRGKFPLYLRLLDAFLGDKRTAKQIADVLANEPGMEELDEKTVWAQLQASKRMMRPEGYLSILSPPSKR